MDHIARFQLTRQGSGLPDDDLTTPRTVDGLDLHFEEPTSGLPFLALETSIDVKADITKEDWSLRGMHQIPLRSLRPPSCSQIFSRAARGLADLFPVLRWMPSLTKSQIFSDMVAGVTVAVMLIPQSMSYADIAGLQYIYGMYSGLLPAFVYSLMGTSRQLAVGPVAMVSLLTNAGLDGQLDDLPCCNIGGMKQSEACPHEYAKLAFILSLLCGVMQFAAGLLQGGFLVAFLGHPVVSGFTSGAAIIIGLSQMK
jgi:hypothetical protein